MASGCDNHWGSSLESCGIGYSSALILYLPSFTGEVDRTTQEQLTPEMRRTLLRAFADRMLLKVSAMDDPEDLPGVEKAVRVAAMIERVYSRCDRAERQKPDSCKLEAERATHKETAIKAQISLANTLKWGDERLRDLGPWWDAVCHSNSAIPRTRPTERVGKAPEYFSMPLLY
jgi:hypothetical protein